MMQRTFFSAFAAILLSAAVVPPAAAFVVPVKSTTSTVTGVYRPLDLTLDTLLPGINTLSYSGGDLSFLVGLTGGFSSSAFAGYSASGLAGNWTLSLSNSGVGKVVDVGTNSLTLRALDNGVQIGTLTYNGGLQVLVGALPISGVDTPAIGDVFQLRSVAVGPVFTVDCIDGTSTCTNFVLTGSQNLEQVGPYVGGTINPDKQNQTCGQNYDCALSGLTAVPEPATLALLGIGLAGLGLSRRTRA